MNKELYLALSNYLYEHEQHCRLGSISASDVLDFINDIMKELDPSFIPPEIYI